MCRLMAYCCNNFHKTASYRMWENIGGGKNWRIVSHSPIFYSPIISVLEIQESISCNFEIADTIARLLKYFKRCDTQKKEKLDTLADPDGSLSKDIRSSSIGTTNTCMHQVQQEASSETRSQGPYISLTPAQKFSLSYK